MGSDDIGRISIAGILGVVGAVAVTKPELVGPTGLNEGIVRWIFYIIACGLVVNTQEGKPFLTLFFASLFSAFTLIATISFKLFILSGGIRLSGVEINFISNFKLTTIILFVLFVASTTAIILSSYSRGLILSLLDQLFSVEIEKAQKIEAILNRVVSIGTIGAIIVFSII